LDEEDDDMALLSGIYTNVEEIFVFSAGFPGFGRESFEKRSDV
jgi:hypothetical protein